MTNVALEITARCENCNEIIAVNAAVNKIWCSKCKGATLFPDELWGMLLTDIIAEADEMHLGEARKTSIENPKAGLVRVNFKKTNPVCSQCHKILPINNEDETMACSHCGAAMLKRPVPPKLNNKKLLYFLNEDLYQINEAQEKSLIVKPVEFSCSNCGAPLHTDGSNRMINCSFCKTNFMLPDVVWHRLHPSEKVKPWYIVYQSQKSDKLKPWEFEQIKQVCCDNENVLYCVGETKGNVPAIWAMDAECQLKWMNIIPANKRWLEYFSEIILLPDDKVLIWDPEAHTALVYNKHSGDFIGELGGIEPVDAKIHTLDFYNFTAFAADPDGTFVALVGRRILRFSDKGSGVFLWPKSFFSFRKLRPIYKKTEKKPEKRDNHDIIEGGFVLPHKLRNKTNIYSYVSERSTYLHIDHNSNLFLLSPFKGNEQHEIIGGAILTKFNRNGKIVFKKELEIYGVEQFRVKTDGRGYAYVLMYDGRADYTDNGRIIRISPDGKVMETIVETTFEAASPSMGCFAVGNDGTLYTFCCGNQMRIYSPEGKQIWRNASAREADVKSNSKE